MSRPIPALFAPLVEQLELERPKIVTMHQLEALVRAFNLSTAPSLVAARLRKHGWLLPTGVRGVYEFAPAERAGPISDGDPLLRVRAILSQDPERPLAAALGTALALQNITDRSPDVPEVAIPKDHQIPRPLRGSDVRIVRFRWWVSAPLMQGVPVHRPATVLVHLAHRPTDVRSWAAMLEALPQLVAAVTIEEVAAELRERPRSTYVRLAYLTQGVAPELARWLKISPASKVWFGPRGPLRRHSAAWNVADTILPFSPDELSPANLSTTGSTTAGSPDTSRGVSDGATSTDR